MAAYQRAYFPLKTMNLTQGYGALSYSHANTYALDFGGKHEIYAAFDCKVTKLYVKEGHSNEVWLTSTKKVLCCNGYYGYLTIAYVHPDDIRKLKVGQKFKQGELVCTTNKMTGNVTGPHLHLELAVGTEAGWEPGNKNYAIKNRVKPEEYLFAYDDAVIGKDTYKLKKYTFKKEKDMLYDIKDDVYVHRTADFKVDTRIGEFKKGRQAIVFGSKNKSYFAYSWGIEGYVAKNYLKKSS